MVPANQGSRGAMVTWTVVSTILFVTATVFAIYYYVNADRIASEAATTATKFREVVSEPQLTSPEVTALKELKSGENAEAMGFNPSMTLLDVALKQRDDLAKRVAVSPDFARAMQSTDRAVAEARARAQESGIERLPDSSLNDLINALSDALLARSNEANKLREDLAAAQKAQENSARELATAREAMDRQLAEVRASEQAALDNTGTYTMTKDEQIRQIQEAFSQSEQVSQEALQQALVQISDLQRGNDQLREQLQTLQARLAPLRVNVADPVLRQADGQVVRLPGGDVVYIDLGQGDQISPGMTFQVYDKVEGVPSPGAGADEDSPLPLGKASIEVVRVGPTSSECRIVRRQPGQTLTEGDLIVNLVYDRNTRYNFKVFGAFDLDRNGVPTGADAEVIKRLITQWGGRLTEDVNVDTDFVVLGFEPEIPVFTRDELIDPINQAKYDQARADLDAYDEVRRLAQEYNIPILNQNRFLYFVGFYELSRR